MCTAPEGRPSRRIVIVRVKATPLLRVASTAVDRDAVVTITCRQVMSASRMGQFLATYLAKTIY